MSAAAQHDRETILPIIRHRLIFQERMTVLTPTGPLPQVIFQDAQERRNMGAMELRAVDKKFRPPAAMSGV